MIKLLTTKQIRALDAFTIQHEGILSIDLMERACRAFVDWFVQRVDARKTIGIVCGTGNNGGDGLGVARMLEGWGYPVKVWIVRGSGSGSEDFKVNLERLQKTTDVMEIIDAPEASLFLDCDVLIDAIFGSGLSRPVEGIYAQTIRAINSANVAVIAIDIPSGLRTDQPSSGEVVRASHTVSFQLPKLAFLLPQSYAYTGEWVTVDIGLSRKFIREAETEKYLITASGVHELVKPRRKFDHKGTFGHALIIAGSYGKMGAALLSSRAALRAGTGLLTAHIPKCGYTIFQTAIHEAMVNVDRDEQYFTGVDAPDKFTVIGVGPGLGQEPQTIEAFGQLIKKFRKPLVIDADALNILSAHRDLLNDVPEGSLLTPHPKEFERIAGKPKDDFDRLRLQQELSARLKSVVLVKGAYSTIAVPDGRLFFNSTGNPGMATGGSGDVLTGILTGLMAQGYTAEEAAIIGVYVHGFSGDLAAAEKGTHSLIASDLVEFLPQSLYKVSRQ